MSTHGSPYRMAEEKMRFLYTIAALVLIVALSGCSSNAPVRVSADHFGITPDEDSVQVFTLTNDSGVEVRLTNYGGIILSILAPDRQGDVEDVTLGFDSLSHYVERNPFFGALVGRYGNRIGDATFEIDGTRYVLAANNGPNHLHGGRKGFDKVVWQAEPFQHEGDAGVTLTRVSPHDEEGYPGNLDVRVTYRLTPDNELAIEYHATTDQPTHVNLTNHTYFNLGGHDSGDVLDHEVLLNADAITAVDAELIPTGELRPVSDTPFDFREPAPIGARIDDTTDVQIRHGGGYDHNYVLNRSDASPDSLMLAARVVEPESGRVLEVFTTEPGVQFYTGNFLDGSLTGRDEVVYERRAGFCLETQHFPDSPNKPQFPSTLLRPGETYASKTIFRFDTQE